tara:strand:+ start:206 stop:445 length:240 start_codon:yes stop_codon:yes gene_type:complete
MSDKQVYDVVTKPEHYNQDNCIECIDAIRAALGSGFKEYLQGNILKYIWRHKYKNGVEDLKKASWYLDRLIEAEISNDS